MTWIECIISLSFSFSATCLTEEDMASFLKEGTVDIIAVPNGMHRLGLELLLHVSLFTVEKMPRFGKSDFQRQRL